METKVAVIDREHMRDEELAEAAEILRNGGLVAFPTETVYGLGANGLDEEAARRIYAAKGRPSDNPLILHISSADEMIPLVKEVPAAAEKLMEAFWPGPLTMIFRKSGIVPYGTTGGLDTVAVRMPSDAVANRLIALAGVPVAAPSANLSGRPSPTTAMHVIEDMNGRIEMILDGGPVGIGLESTIVDVTGPVPVLLRPGAVTMEMLQAVVGRVEIDPAIAGPMAADVRPKAPGMKYRHYAPKAQLILVEDRDARGAAGSGSALPEAAAGSGSALPEAAAGSGSAACEAAKRSDSALPEAAAGSDSAACGAASEDRTAESGAEEAAVRLPVSRAVVDEINRLTRLRISEGRRVGILCTDETRDLYPEGVVRSVGVRGREETIAHSLFSVLRDFDELAVDVIYSESFARDHLGQAIMNRLTKAAGYQVIYTEENAGKT